MRNGRLIISYLRGHGSPQIFIKKVAIKKITIKHEVPKVQEVPREVKEPIQEEVQKEVPLYSRDDLEKVFLGEPEENARSLAEEIGLTFKNEELIVEEGIKKLHYYHPIDTDIEPGVQEPDIYRDVILTIDLDTDRVKEVFSHL